MSRCLLVAFAVLAFAAPSAGATGSFRPRIGTAMGIIPAHGGRETASGTSIPVVFHGGTVMRGVTVHTVFWAPPGFKFSGSPAAGVPGYEALQQQFLADAAHDSGATGNVFSVLGEYPDGSGGGLYHFAYDPATDSVDDTSPYPVKARQCVSPSGVATCVTDLQLQQELDRVITAHDPAGRGLHDMWFVYLPPNVDTCVNAGACGTNSFAGYHSLSNLGHGLVIYANIPDPLIEFTPPQGTDPQGSPEGESAIDTVAHEAVEAITDPLGVGWMDPNGFEVGDKCENGPQQGTPLGFAPNGAPYNQVINGRHYFLQMMWSNTSLGCLPSSTSTASALPLATVNMTQFSSTITGNIGRAKSRVSATILLIRGGAPVAAGQGSSDAHGSWRVSLRSLRDGSPRGVGDDRDLILIRYGTGGPAPDVIATGSGGNPFSESGWTGWYSLDTGYAVSRTSVQLGPCAQTGVLTVTVDGGATAPPVEHCETETDFATIATKHLGPGTTLRLSSQDNRAVALENPAGALVRLTVGLGEPEAIPALGNSQIAFPITGFATCLANLRAQTVRCSGLVRGARYSLSRRRGRLVRSAKASASGVALFSGFGVMPWIRGGDLLTLRNRAHRALTALHVAHLRIDLKASETVASSGRCEPGDYVGAPLSDAPVATGIGVPGATGTGSICPLSGRAKGLPISELSQVDDRSGGQTRTEVPVFAGTAPLQDATLYGGFVALAQTAVPGVHGSSVATHTRVSLTISPAGSRRVIFRAANVGTPRGIVVGRLPQGNYHATWVLSDANGDTRTLLTQFVEAR